MRYGFNLVQEMRWPRGGFADPSYDGIKADPPEGCEVEDFGGVFGLVCVREADSILDAVAELVSEIRDRYGLQMDSLGVEKPGEWLGDDADGYSGIITTHLLLAAVVRAGYLGFNDKDVERFLVKVGTAHPRERG